MNWFRRPSCKKEYSDRNADAETIRESLRNRKIPDPIAAMFLDEYLYTRRSKKPEPLSYNDMGQCVEPLSSTPLIIGAYLNSKAEE